MYNIGSRGCTLAQTKKCPPRGVPSRVGPRPSGDGAERLTNQTFLGMPPSTPGGPASPSLQPGSCSPARANEPSALSLQPWQKWNVGASPCVNQMRCLTTLCYRQRRSRRARMANWQFVHGCRAPGRKRSRFKTKLVIRVHPVTTITFTAVNVCVQNALNAHCASIVGRSSSATSAVGAPCYCCCGASGGRR